MRFARITGRDADDRSGIKRQEWRRINCSYTQSLGALGTLVLPFLALTIVANKIPNDYSLALSAQLLGGGFQRVRRWIWTLAGSVTYAVIAIRASGSFNQTLKHFLLLLTRW